MQVMDGAKGVGAVLLMCALQVGCGPVLYVSDVVEAEAGLERAREAKAGRLAPFEYYSALAYLDKAREQAVDGQYEDAIRFARVSRVYGERAAKLARSGTHEDHSEE